MVKSMLTYVVDMPEDEAFRFELEVRNVLQDVQGYWFGASSLLLLPASGDLTMGSNLDDHAL